MSESVGQQQLQLKWPDHAFLRDLADTVRAHNLFFIPFFGAFVGFIIAKSQYIIDVGIIIQIEVFITFILGVVYSFITYNYLESIAAHCFMLGVKSKTSASAEEKKTIGELVIKIPRMMDIERRAFHWFMYVLWINTASVLLDIFFGRTINLLLAAIVSRFISH